MSQYFAKLDENNVVVHVAVTTPEFMAANPERYEGRWVETFIGVEGKTYAGIGYVYDEVAEDFSFSEVVTPQPLPPYSE